MVQAKFDPALAFKFDLGRGTVSQVGAGPRLVVPADILVKLLDGASPEVIRDAGHHLGTELGRRAQQALPDIESASPDQVLEFLGGEFALLGLGNLGFERWGRALVFSLHDSPLGSSGDEFVSAIFDGALLRLFGKATRSVRLKRDDGRARFLVSGEQAASQVAAWLDTGVSWGEALTRLEAEASEGEA